MLELIFDVTFDETILIWVGSDFTTSLRAVLVHCYLGSDHLIFMGREDYNGPGFFFFSDFPKLNPVFFIFVYFIFIILDIFPTSFMHYHVK